MALTSPVPSVATELVEPHSVKSMGCQVVAKRAARLLHIESSVKSRLAEHTSCLAGLPPYCDSTAMRRRIVWIVEVHDVLLPSLPEEAD